MSLLLLLLLLLLVAVCSHAQEGLCNISSHMMMHFPETPQLYGRWSAGSCRNHERAHALLATRVSWNEA